jgi:hypothetical protein
MWYTRKMEDDMLLTDLLNELTGTNNGHRPTLTEKDGEAIAYLLANAAWFNHAGSASGNKNNKHKHSGKKSIREGGI